jgi:hypothetical protein
MLPNFYRKIVSGQSNYLGTVTTHEIERNEMGNRVTKSKILDSINKKYNSVFVKVQRADGSWLLKNNLRCALLVTENYYITKILSNRFLTKRTFFSNHLNSRFNNSKLN